MDRCRLLILAPRRLPVTGERPCIQDQSGLYGEVQISLVYQRFQKNEERREEGRKKERKGYGEVEGWGGVGAGTQCPRTPVPQGSGRG